MEYAHRLDHLLRAAAERSPDKVAIESDQGSLTFGALDEAADRVAAELAEQGRQAWGSGRYPSREESRGGRFALRHDACRGGLRAAGRDSSAIPHRLHRHRLRHRCADLRALVDRRLRGVDPAAAPRGIACGSPCPDGFAGWDEVHSDERAAPPLQSVDSDLAYILYTSGSTGKPKGVAISHRSSLTFVRWAHQTLELTESDVFSSHAPLHFDLSTLDLFGSAAAGATVELVPAGGSPVPDPACRVDPREGDHRLVLGPFGADDDRPLRGPRGRRL